VILALLLACRLTTVASRRPDFAFARPMEDMGVMLRRYEWHALHAGASSVATVAIAQLGVRPRTAAIAATLLTGLAPHVVGVLRCRYPYDPADWIADLVIAGAPIAVAGVHGRVQLSVRILSYGATYALAAPFASP
jgi:hypothetical protein